MMSNLTPFASQNMAGCYVWGWFVACELQIFIFLPFFIWACYKIGKLKPFLIGATFLGGCLLNGFLIWDGNYSADVIGQ
jgi:hypothetical protein